MNRYLYLTKQCVIPSNLRCGICGDFLAWDVFHQWTHVKVLPMIYIRESGKILDLKDDEQV